MGPQAQFCSNMACPVRGQTGAGNIQIHSQPVLSMHAMQQTFSESKGTALYGLKKEPALFVIVTLLAHRYPVQAVVVAYGLDERTVWQWLLRAGFASFA